MLDHRSAWWLRVMGRPKTGISSEQLSARLLVLSPQIFGAATPQNWKPDEQRDFTKRTFVTQPGAATGLSYVRRQYENPLKVLMGVVGLVLLIACANIAKLDAGTRGGAAKENCCAFGRGCFALAADPAIVDGMYSALFDRRAAGRAVRALGSDAFGAIYFHHARTKYFSTSRWIRA